MSLKCLLANLNIRNQARECPVLPILPCAGFPRILSNAELCLLYCMWNWYEWFHLVNHHFCIYWIILLSAFWSFFVKCTICFLTTMTAVSSAKVAIIICSSITRSLVYRRGIALISARFPVEFPSRSASTPRIVYHNAVVPLRVQGCHCGHSL